MRLALLLALLMACETEECGPYLLECYEECAAQELGIISFSCDRRDAEESICKCGEDGFLPEVYE